MVSVTLDILKLLKLPGVEPAQELAAVKAFYIKLAEMMLRSPESLTTLKICNERERNKRVPWSLHLARRTLPAAPLNCVQDSQELTLFAKESPIIDAYLRQVALGLGRLGPWSWATVTEDQLFGYGQGPWRKNFESKQDQRHPS